MRTAWAFASVIFVALALVPVGAHLAELPHKMNLSSHDYLVVQQLYRGWALFGIVAVGALVSTAGLVIATRGEPRSFALTLAAFLCILTTQIIFWVFTQPVNRATRNWTYLPTDWPRLRVQWEYSHGAAAVLTLAALIFLFVALVPRRTA